MYEAEIRKAKDFLLAAQNDDGSFPTSRDGLDAHYKTPSALLDVGELRAATLLLDWIKANQLQPDGDFRTASGKFCFSWHDDAYLYSNSWLVIGAHRMLRFDIFIPAARFIAGLQDESTGGFYHAPPAGDENNHLNALVTSWAGVAMLTCGRIAEATAAGDFLVNLLEQQTEPEVLLFLNAEPRTGKLLRGLPAGAVKGEPKELYERVDSRSPNQRYFHPGIQALLLGRLHMATGEEKYLLAAKTLIEFFQRCRPDRMEDTTSCKAGAAAAVLYQITGDERYRKLALGIGDYLASIQLDDGSWTFTGVPAEECHLYWKLDVASEFIIWLTHIDLAVRGD